MVKVSDHCLIIPTPPPSSRGTLRSLGAHRYFPSQVPVHLVVNHEPPPRLSPSRLHFQPAAASLVSPPSDSTRDSRAHSILNHHRRQRPRFLPSWLRRQTRHVPPSWLRPAATRRHAARRKIRTLHRTTRSTTRPSPQWARTLTPASKTRKEARNGRIRPRTVTISVVSALRSLMTPHAGPFAQRSSSFPLPGFRYTSIRCSAAISPLPFPSRGCVSDRQRRLQVRSCPFFLAATC
jgi:hypothetical protein